MKFNIYDYQNKPTRIDTGDREIEYIDDVDDVGDGIVDILYIDGGLDVVLRHMDEELLRMNEEELKRVKETL